MTQQLKSLSSKGLDQIQGNMTIVIIVTSVTIVTIVIEVDEEGAATSQEGEDKDLTLVTSSYSAMSLTS